MLLESASRDENAMYALLFGEAAGTTVEEDEGDDSPVSLLSLLSSDSPMLLLAAALGFAPPSDAPPDADVCWCWEGHNLPAPQVPTKTADFKASQLKLGAADVRLRPEY